jgi:hypothetical protein
MKQLVERTLRLVATLIGASAIGSVMSVGAVVQGSQDEIRGEHAGRGDDARQWIGRRAGVHIATEASVTDMVAQLGVAVAF